VPVSWLEREQLDTAERMVIGTLPTCAA
jgi:hypothetical protein